MTIRTQGRVEGDADEDVPLSSSERTRSRGGGCGLRAWRGRCRTRSGMPTGSRCDAEQSWRWLFGAWYGVRYKGRAGVVMMGRAELS